MIMKNRKNTWIVARERSKNLVNLNLCNSLISLRLIVVCFHLRQLHLWFFLLIPYCVQHHLVLKEVYFIFFFVCFHIQQLHLLIFLTTSLCFKLILVCTKKYLLFFDLHHFVLWFRCPDSHGSQLRSRTF